MIADPKNMIPLSKEMKKRIVHLEEIAREANLKIIVINSENIVLPALAELTMIEKEEVLSFL